jgi:hypothetical protein
MYGDIFFYSSERDHYSERSKLPSVSVDKPPKTSLTVLNGQTDYRSSVEKDGHRYSYRQNKDEKLYTGLVERENIHTLPVATQKEDSRYVPGIESKKKYH